MIRRILGGPSRNVFVGLTMLILISVVATPNVAPRLLGRFVPGFYEGVPCSWLRIGDDRAFHQSLLGRDLQNANPLSLDIVASNLPRDPSGVLTLRIVLTNNSVGALALVYNENQVITGDNGTSGLGVIFTPPVTVAIGAARQDSPTVPEGNIRILGPRQKCVHTITIPAGNMLIDPSFQQGAGQVAAYYRNNSVGTVVAAPGAVATPVYTDQGLWTGFVQSLPVPVPVSAQ